MVPPASEEIAPVKFKMVTIVSASSRSALDIIGPLYESAVARGFGACRIRRFPPRLLADLPVLLERFAIVIYFVGNN